MLGPIMWIPTMLGKKAGVPYVLRFGLRRRDQASGMIGNILLFISAVFAAVAVNSHLRRAAVIVNCHSTQHPWMETGERGTIQVGKGNLLHLFLRHSDPPHCHLRRWPRINPRGRCQVRIKRRPTKSSTCPLSKDLKDMPLSRHRSPWQFNKAIVRGNRFLKLHGNKLKDNQLVHKTMDNIHTSAQV